MSKKNKKLMCAVYLSVDAPDKEIQDKEEKQFRYIKDYCKGNGLKIVKSYHRAGLSRCEMQKHFVELARQIEVGVRSVYESRSDCGSRWQSIFRR